jgi:hypothetical protein
VALKHLVRTDPTTTYSPSRYSERPRRRLAVRFALECDYFDARTIHVDGGLSC